VLLSDASIDVSVRLQVAVFVNGVMYSNATCGGPPLNNTCTARCSLAHKRNHTHTWTCTLRRDDSDSEMCGAAPVWFGPPLSFNPWSSGVASNVAIRGLYLLTTALQQQDVQQIMSGSGWRRGAARRSRWSRVMCWLL
jgi:hypothetical protein